MDKIDIHVYPMNVVLYTPPSRLDTVRRFAREYIRYNEYWDKRRQKLMRVPEASYVFYTEDRSEIRFLRTMLDEFLSLLKLLNHKEGIDYDITYHDINNVVDDIRPTLKPDFKPSEEREQPQVIDFATQFNTGSILLKLSGGAGKSACSIFTIDRFKERFAAVMRQSLLGKDLDEGWLKDFEKAYIINRNEICRVQGSTQLKSLINICLEKGYNPYKTMLFSNKTIMQYLKYYEQYSAEDFKNLGYNCTPQDLPVLLGINSIVVDEIHFDHHLNCKMASYFKVKRFIGATATPDFDNKFSDRMVKLLFPLDRRYQQQKSIIHIQPLSYHYKLENPDRVRFDGFRGYSHIKFEQSIMKKQKSKLAYFDMIHKIVEDIHVPKYSIKPEYKLLITVASIDMANELSDYIGDKYPDKIVTSYVDKDPLSNLYQSDICVSTVQGSGTGHDIPNLATVIMTNAINATTTNLQCAWRLRKLKEEETEHSFVYFVCDDIYAHRKYDTAKKQFVFKGKALPVKDIQSNITIPT